MLTRSVTVDAMIDIFNVNNANTVTRIQSFYTDLANFGKPAEIMFPRAARIGLLLNL